MSQAARYRPQPVDHEREFRIDELFFSLTDSKGKITFANEVFTRLSGWKENELVGSPHNIIRHPDMPRAVFYLMWEYLKAGKSFVGYVKNMAKDGAYYWVIALVFPCSGGYFSIRLKPGSKNFAYIRKLYLRMLSEEREYAEQKDDKRGMMSAVDLFSRQLKQDGFENYETFMWKALEDEMRFREEGLKRQNFSRKNREDAVPEKILLFESHLTGLFEQLKSLKELHGKLTEHSQYILKLSRTIRLLSLNAQVGSSRMDGDGASLSAVAGQMGEQSMGGERMLADMQKHITSLSKLLDKMNFDIITAKLQVEMSTVFMNEVHSNGEDSYRSDIPVSGVLKNLQKAFAPRLLLVADEVGRIPSSLRDLRTRVYEIERFLYVLRFIHSAGKIEVARLQDATSFANTFAELIREVNTADDKLKELTGYVERNQQMNNTFLESERVLSAAKEFTDRYAKESDSETDQQETDRKGAVPVKSDDSGYREEGHEGNETPPADQEELVALEEDPDDF
ncbi:PAS domain-containing protein [Balneolales bacterium ANBcel1]|nr:PAS domain-containing protein [Balneolales bacterium ANBcel1]